MEIITQQTNHVREKQRFLFAQALQSGDDFLVVSSWRSEKDLRAHVESDLAHNVLTRLSPLMIGESSHTMWRCWFIRPFPHHEIRRPQALWIFLFHLNGNPPNDDSRWRGDGDLQTAI